MLQDLRKMVDRIRKFQILNDQVFASLNRYLIPGHDHVRPAFGVVVEHFSPPVTHCRESVAWCSGCRFHLIWAQPASAVSRACVSVSVLAADFISFGTSVCSEPSLCQCEWAVEFNIPLDSQLVRSKLWCCCKCFRLFYFDNKNSLFLSDFYLIHNFAVSYKFDV